MSRLSNSLTIPARNAGAFVRALSLSLSRSRFVRTSSKWKVGTQTGASWKVHAVKHAYTRQAKRAMNDQVKIEREEFILVELNLNVSTVTRRPWLQSAQFVVDGSWDECRLKSRTKENKSFKFIKGEDKRFFFNKGGGRTIQPSTCCQSDWTIAWLLLRCFFFCLFSGSLRRTYYTFSHRYTREKSGRGLRIFKLPSAAAARALSWLFLFLSIPFIVVRFLRKKKMIISWRTVDSRLYFDDNLLLIVSLYFKLVISFVFTAWFRGAGHEQRRCPQPTI